MQLLEVLVIVIWDEFLKILKEEAGSQLVETWFKSVRLDTWNSSTQYVVLRAPNQFVRSWIQDHYTELIKKHLGRLLSATSLKVSILCKEDVSETKNIIPASMTTSNELTSSFLPPPIGKKNESTATRAIVPRDTKTALVSKDRKTKKREGSNINPAYTFDSFVVGPTNSLAHAAAFAIGENLGKIYNPLYIYGGTGLGKTHLLHAIANEVKKQKPSVVIAYETSDNFINEFINAIRFDRSDQFRKRYELVDLFLLDDIQFFSNKEQTQEIFFHIFNSLYERQKQIILSSDTFPQEIKGLQNRLKSRMEWGLVADIQMPTLETKIAILKKKAEANNIQLSDDVADFIAERVLSNIRELEGALIRVCAFASLTNTPISLEMARKVLLNLGASQERRRDNIALDNIIRVISRHYDVSPVDIKSKSRHKDIAAVRQVAFYLMKKLTYHSLQAIGASVGGRDHSTVIHAIQKVDTMIAGDKHFEAKIKQLEHEIISS
ncbi:chromosomal replication initiator protein DnaA [Candidatus Dependentiae bacterium]|nr:chromosomal replication initiator protein DnaA [Candidatus Dependentiae bacterium]